MKKKLCLLSIAIVAFALASCDGDNDKAIIQGMVKGFNESCPIATDAYSTITAIELDHDTLVYKAVTTEEVWSIENLKKNAAYTKKLIKLNLARQGNKSNEKAAMQKIADCGYWIKWIYLGQKSNDRYTLLISLEEMQEGLSKTGSQKAYSDEMLQLIVEQENVQGGTEIDTGMMLKQAVLEDKAVVYTIEMDEQYYDVSLLKEAETEMKDNMAIYLASQKPMMQALVQTNRELIYRKHKREKLFAHIQC
ncbi:MAG: hypothetical protein IJV27_08590 [Prevotella sp.]|nr:hypothetical protein [Prevotella sp.]